MPPTLTGRSRPHWLGIGDSAEVKADLCATPGVKVRSPEVHAITWSRNSKQFLLLAVRLQSLTNLSNCWAGSAGKCRYRCTKPWTSIVAAGNAALR